MKTQSAVYFVGLAATVYAVLTLAAASPAAHGKARTTRGFKNAALSTARGFGKRGGLQIEDILSAQEPSRDLISERQDTQSLPLEWFADEIVGNRELARLFLSNLVDRNQDGELTADELRPSY